MPDRTIFLLSLEILCISRRRIPGCRAQATCRRGAGLAARVRSSAADGTRAVTCRVYAVPMWRDPWDDDAEMFAEEARRKRDQDAREFWGPDPGEDDPERELDPEGERFTTAEYWTELAGGTR